MKTAKEILSKRDSFYSTNVYKTGERAYRESDVILAMEEFTEQLRAELEAVRAERDELKRHRSGKKIKQNENRNNISC